jgi:hypothetical protein
MLAALALNLCACEDQGRTLRMKVAHYRTPCQAWVPTTCQVVDLGDGRGPVFWSETIHGLDWTWGHEYDVLVAESDTGLRGEDAPWLRYDLLSIKSDRRVAEDAEFTIYANRDPTFGSPVSVTSATGGTLRDGTPFVCPAEQLCTDLVALVAAEQSVTVTFGYSPGVALPLIVRAAVAP